MNTHVLKFGGTSMGTFESIEQVAQIINRALDPIVVVSAVSGVTNSLIELIELAKARKVRSISLDLNELENIHRMILFRFAEEARDEIWENDFAPLFEDLNKILTGIGYVGDVSDRTYAYICSFGERLSSRLLVYALGRTGVDCERIDSDRLIRTDNNYLDANVDQGRTMAACKRVLFPIIERGVVPIITGFFGSDSSRDITLLGCGGSDYSAALIAAAVNAAELQIWTDVDGFYSADPGQFGEATLIEGLSFAEASELAYFGAKVLHPKTIQPAIQKHIPVRILNTFNPEGSGTLITARVDKSIKSITYKNGISIINICSLGMLDAFGFLSKIFDVFKRHEVTVDVVSTSEVSVSVSVDGMISDDLIIDLKEFANVRILEGQAIICLVGEGIKTMPGISGRLFSAIQDFNVSMISQGASQRNITFLVNQNETAQVVVRVFNEFFNTNNNERFNSRSRGRNRRSRARNNQMPARA